MDNEEALNTVRRHLSASRETLVGCLADDRFTNAIVRIAAYIEETLRRGGKVMFAGNGGSAADAQHIAGEFVSRLNFDRNPIAGIALTTDTSVLTAIGNDYGFDKVFSRQIQGIGRNGDVFVAISTSGRSLNILEAITSARALGIHTVALTGSAGGPIVTMCDVVLEAPSEATPLIQQIHIIAAHAVCELVEQALFGAAR